MTQASESRHYSDTGHWEKRYNAHYQVASGKLMNTAYRAIHSPFTAASRRRIASDALLAALVVGYATVFSVLSIEQYEGYHRLTRDLATFQQLFWNSLHGLFFTGSTFAMFGGGTNTLANHFSPGLLILLPAFALWPDPRLLLIAQSIAYALATVPIVLFARERALSEPIALLVGAVYLSQPGLQQANLFEFHEISLATPILAFLVYLAHRRASPAAILAIAFLAMSIKEDVSLTVAAIGLYTCLALRRWRLGAVVAIVGLIWAVAVIGFVMPALNVDGHRFIHTTQYADLGDTPAAILWNVVTHPLAVAARLTTPPKLSFLAGLLLPYGLLPLLGGPLLVLAAPTVGYLLLSNDPTFASLRFHHAAPVMPLLAMASADGLCRLRRLAQLRGSPGSARIFRLAQPAWMMLAAVGGAYLFTWGPFAGNLTPALFQFDEQARAAETIVRQVPESSSVAASDTIVGHLASRREITEFPAVDGADFVVLDTREAYFGDSTQLDSWPWSEMDHIWHDGTWRLVDVQNHFLLLAREPPTACDSPGARQLNVNFGDDLELVSYQLPVGRSVQPGDDLKIVLGWRALRPIARDYTMSLKLRNAQGVRIWQEDAGAWAGAYPTREWLPGECVPDVRHIRIPPDAPPGPYQVSLNVYGPGVGALPVANESARQFGNVALIGLVPVVSVGQPRQWTGDWTPISATFSGQLVELRRVWVNRSAVSPGDWLSVAFEWQARRPMRENYTIFVHLRDSTSRLWGQRDEQPGQGYQATSHWVPGEMVQSSLMLQVRPDTPPGRYSLDIGMYRLETLQNLRVDGSADDWITVGEITVR